MNLEDIPMKYRAAIAALLRQQVEAKRVKHQANLDRPRSLYIGGLAPFTREEKQSRFDDRVAPYHTIIEWLMAPAAEPPT